MNISPRRSVCSKATKLERGVRQAQRGHKWGKDRRRRLEDICKQGQCGGLVWLQPLKLGLCFHLRAALHNDTTHSIDATVTHVHTLILDLDHLALEVLLFKQHDLHRGDVPLHQSSEHCILIKQ